MIVVNSGGGSGGIVRPNFEANPVQCECLSCKQTQMTDVEYETSAKQWWYAILLCIFGFGWCFCIPFCMKDQGQYKHTCKNCKAVQGQHGDTSSKCCPKVCFAIMTIGILVIVIMIVSAGASVASDFSDLDYSYYSYSSYSYSPSSYSYSSSSSTSYWCSITENYYGTCTTSSTCRGNRLCSYYGYCTGSSGC